MLVGCQSVSSDGGCQHVTHRGLARVPVVACSLPAHVLSLAQVCANVKHDAPEAAVLGTVQHYARLVDGVWVLKRCVVLRVIDSRVVCYVWTRRGVSPVWR